MEPTDQVAMRKETILKDDGRYLIYYRFEETPESQGAGDRQAEAR